MLIHFSIVISVCLALLTLGDIYLLINHCRKRSSALMNEKAMLQMAGDPRIPFGRMCVQLPVYNEPARVSGAIRAVCQACTATLRAATSSPSRRR